MEGSDQYINDILAYLGNEMSESDRYEFERKMEADPFLMDAVDGYEQMGVAQAKEGLKLLQGKLERKNRSKIVPIWLRAAASIVLIVGIGSLWFLNNHTKEPTLVSDNIDVLKKESEPVVELPSESDVSPIEEEGVAVVSEIETEFEQDQIQEKVTQERVFEKVSKKSVKRAAIKEAEQGQDVNMDLRYEDNAVKAERELVGQMAGVDFAEVEGSGEIDDLMVKAKVTSFKDTLMASYRGRVVDEAGIPLPGVSVRSAIKENSDLAGYVNNVTMTDVEGNFEIQAPEEGAVLELSSIGFKDQLASAKKDSMGELVMESENLALDEVVTIGYGSAKRKSYIKDTAGSELGYLTAIPEGGLRRLVKKLEKELVYPVEGKKKINVDVFVLASGVIDKVVFEEVVLDETFNQLLVSKLNQIKWQVPQVNGAPVASYVKIEFEFKGNK